MKDDAGTNGTPLADDAPQLPAWVRPFVESGLAGTDRAYRVTVLAKMQELAVTCRYDAIDAALDLVPVTELADTSLLTLLRGSWRFRSALRDWSGFRDRVAAVLHGRGAPVDRLLVGMYD